MIYQDNEYRYNVVTGIPSRRRVFTLVPVPAWRRNLFERSDKDTVDSHPAFLFLEILKSVHDGAVTSVLILTFH